MAVKFKKKEEINLGEGLTVKPSLLDTCNINSIQETVDAYVELEAVIHKMKVSLEPLLDSQTKLKQVLKDHCEQFEPDKKVTLDGLIHQIEASACSQQTVVTNDNEEISHVIGQEAFFKLAKFSITDLRKYTPEEKLAKITTTARTGARSLKIII